LATQDKERLYGVDDGVLEFEGFEDGEEEKMRSHTLVDEMTKFIQAHFSTEETKQDEIKDEIVLCVSLSGGVDSMVITRVLVVLSHLLPLKVVACHINYGNRGESDREATFLSSWCSSIGVDVFEVLQIEEIKRGVTPREEYEKRSRELRFSFYQEV